MRPKSLQLPCVAITDPGFRASRHVALACQEGGMLGRYITSYCHFPESNLDRFAMRTPPSLRRQLVPMLRRRQLAGLDPARVASIPWPELASRTAAAALRRDPNAFGQSLAYWQSICFDRLASKRLPDQTGIIYANECSAIHTFEQAKRRGAVTVLEGTFHDSYYSAVLQPESARLGITPPHNRHWKRAFACEIELADHIVTQSDFAAQTYIAAGVPGAKVTAIPLGVDVSAFAPPQQPAPPTDRRLRLLYVGNFSVRKGVARLLEAIERLRLLDIELTLIGAPVPEFLPVYARLRGRDSAHVTWLAPMGRHELAGYYRWADVVVLPTLCDSFGQVPLEAMACGTPVVVTSACGAPVRPDVDGMVIPAADTDALEAAIVRCFQNRDELPIFGDNARHRALEFTWERFRYAMRDFFHGAVNPAASRAGAVPLSAAAAHDGLRSS